jgi:hypothetical protein
MNRLPWYIWNGKAYHASAKAGTQTLLRAILKGNGIKDPGMGNRRAQVHYELDGVIQTSYAPETWERVQFFRHPQHRFESLWRWGCRDHNQGIPARLWDGSPDALLWHIQENLYENVHWLPQCIETPFASKVTPSYAMKDHFKVGKKHRNSTVGEIPYYEIELLHELYRPDFLIWNEYCR